MTWLIPILAGISGLTALYLSRPKSLRWALLTAFLIFVVAVWQSKIEYSQEKLNEALHERTHKELEASVSSLLSLIAYLDVAASDGNLPTTEEDFFSARTADTICNHLNIDAGSLSIPPQTWWQYSGIEGVRIRQQLNMIVTLKAGSLDPELLKLLGNQENSLLITYLTNHWKSGRKNLPGSYCGGVQAGFAESLQELHNVYTLVKQDSLGAGRTMDEPWSYIGRSDLFGKPGRDRV